MRPDRRHRALEFNRARITAAAATVAMALLGAALLEAAEPAEAAFPGTNGRIVFVSERDGDNEIYSMRSNGSGVRQLTNDGATDNQPAVSADGETIAFASNRTGDREIYTMDADDGANLDRVTFNPADQTRPAFSPDGRTIAFESDAGFGDRDIFVFDGTSATNLTPDAPEPGAPDDGSPVFSPDGERIAFESDRSDDREIYTMDADDGANLLRLTFDGRSDDDPNWSPDGERIAFVSTRPNPEGLTNHSIFVMNEDGSGQQRLTNREGEPIAMDLKPTYSPDGQRIAFARAGGAWGGLFEIYALDADDGSGVTRVTSDPMADDEPDWAAATARRCFWRCQPFPPTFPPTSDFVRG